MRNFKKTIGLLSLMLGMSAVVQAEEIEIKDQSYTFEGQRYLGFIAKPTSKIKKKWPGLVMVHNWMGITDETKTQAKRFAEKGFVVMGIDIYGEGVRPKDAEEAGKLATQYKTDRLLFRKRLMAGFDELFLTPTIDKKKIFVAGYCFGGTGAIELARSGAPVKGVISFHGGLDSPTPADGKNIKAPVLALHGADDPYVKAEDIAAFEKDMKTNKVKYSLIKYPGAVHSFTEKGAGSDNSKGAAYNAEADTKSFAEALKFLNK